MNDKVALITGASSGIGRAAALLFALNGYAVVAFGRSEGELGSLRDDSRDSDGSIRIHLGDITEISQVDRVVSETIAGLGRLDVLVNAAGIIKTGNIEDTTLDE